MSEKRVYDKSIIRPKGIPEDPTRCVATVADETGWHFYQCKRKRGHGSDGLYCKQHAKIIERRQQITDSFKNRKSNEQEEV